jgi:hypothetical protein
LTASCQPDGKILVGGFVGYNGSPSQIVQLLPDGSFDPSFSGATGQGYYPREESGSGILDIALQPDGKIVVVGAFHQVDDQRLYYLARLKENGSFDPTFLPVTNLALDGSVNPIFIPPPPRALTGPNCALSMRSPFSRTAVLSWAEINCSPALKETGHCARARCMLLDHCVPRRFRGLLPGTKSARRLGWVGPA